MTDHGDGASDGSAVWLLALARLGFPLTRVASLLGTDLDDLTAGAEPTNVHISEHLRVLTDIVELLRGSLSPAGMQVWLEARSRYLDGRKPVELLREGDAARLREAAEALVEGTYL
jgi:hypothetical protein